MFDLVAYWLGASLLVLLALAIAAFCAYLLLEFVCRTLFKRMRRVYHLSSIAYWLHHYEKRGRKCFLDPEPVPRAAHDFDAPTNLD